MPDGIEPAIAGEAIFIASNGAAVQLVPQTPVGRKRTFGNARGLIKMASGFDEPLDDFTN